MKELTEIVKIENMIYEINGIEVMLDSDLAKLYKCKNGTKEVNQAVKNNISKFPERFSWILSDKESDEFLAKNFDQKQIETRGGKYKNPRVFTEQGVYMLATILKSKTSIDVSIAIMDAFVKMRHYINYNKMILPNRILLLEDKVDSNTKKINELFDKFNPKTISNNCIFFDGEFYDAYSFLWDIFNMAKEELIIIDNYAGKELLDILKNIHIKIIVVSKNIDLILKEKYEKQYGNITFINNDSFHDRFIIVDRNKLFSCGASFKDLGKKCFSINESDNIEYLEELLRKINVKEIR